ncbi:MAG: AAA family ATPase [Candidatus Blackburnbacteria bacterium]|nr:AAA family ATPase [Candidatus Blackburnbacteria bacterium]
MLSPEGVPYQTDNVRTEDESYRKAVHESFIKILEDQGVPYTIIEGSLEERLARIELLLGL